MGVVFYDFWVFKKIVYKKGKLGKNIDKKGYILHSLEYKKCVNFVSFWVWSRFG